MVIGDLFIGYNDGKNEAKFRENFADFYFNYNGIYEKILNRDKYLVLGRKGTGKTILGEYIKKKAEPISNCFCEMCSCRSFKFRELFSLRTKDIKPNEYQSIWEWLILIKLAELMITKFHDVNLEVNSESAIRKFFGSCFIGTKLDMNKIVEVTKSTKITSGISLKFLKINSENVCNQKSKECSYLDYIEDLKFNIFNALSTSESQYTLILDELDDQFGNDELYKSNIISLIKSVDKLNCEFLNADINVKIVIMLRSDIFYMLNDADLNKIEEDNSVKINWGNKSDINSPLVKMVLLKLKQSVDKFENSNINDEEVLDRFFPEKIQKGSREYYLLEYILGRTYLRPRDVITFLKKMKDNSPNEEFFSATTAKNVEKEYSEYLIKEIKNEMHGHISEEFINETFTFLRQYKRKSFTLEQIRKYYEYNKSLYPNLDIKKALFLLFKFGVIGNMWSDGKKTYFSWSHRENATIDYNKKFNIHLGLRKALNIS